MNMNGQLSYLQNDNLTMLFPGQAINFPTNLLTNKKKPLFLPINIYQ